MSNSGLNGVYCVRTTYPRQLQNFDSKLMLYMNYKILAGQIEYETTIGYQLSWNNAPLPC